MKRTTWTSQLLLASVLLAAVLILFENTNIDLQLQDWFFLGRPHEWMVDDKNPVGRLFFYTGIKVLLVVLGVALVIGLIASFRWPALRACRKRLLMVVLSMALVPLVIAGLKNTTNVYWPDQLTRYGGNKPYVKVFESYPAGYKQPHRGYGFPAGHASGGFSLLALYFVFRSKRAKFFGLLAGLALGWTMGLYQMAKGVHFLSHTLVTMLGAWLIILIIYRAIGDDPGAAADQSPVDQARGGLNR